MDDKVISSIKEQIEFLKADLAAPIPQLNEDSEFQPEAMAKILAMREETKRQILHLMDRLAGIEPADSDKTQYRLLLEKISTDHAALDLAKEVGEKFKDEDSTYDLIENAVNQYESTKRLIAEKVLEKLD